MDPWYARAGSTSAKGTTFLRAATWRSRPAAVAAALEKTNRARYLVVSESSPGHTLKYAIDNPHRRDEAWANETVASVQIGRLLYARRSNGSCFVSTKQPTASLPNIAVMLLPSSLPFLRYTVKQRTISWVIRETSGYQPHGVVKLDRQGRIVDATTYSGPTPPTRATVSYPTDAPKIAAPSTDLCKS